jgi:hypothetical protein
MPDDSADLWAYCDQMRNLKKRNTRAFNEAIKEFETYMSDETTPTHGAVALANDAMTCIDNLTLSERADLTTVANAFASVGERPRLLSQRHIDKLLHDAYTNGAADTAKHLISREVLRKWITDQGFKCDDVEINPLSTERWNAMIEEEFHADKRKPSQILEAMGAVWKIDELKTVSDLVKKLKAREA